VVIFMQSFVSLLDLAEAKEAEFLAVDRARKATLWPSSCLERKYLSRL